MTADEQAAYVAQQIQKAFNDPRIHRHNLFDYLGKVAVAAVRETDGRQGETGSDQRRQGVGES